MIVAKDQYAVTSTVPGEKKIAMAIRAEDMGHIMALLAGAYADKLLAVLREYTTNAHDAHVAAGIKRAVEVELPTALTPFLVVRDFGAGLDEQDIAEVYSQYGRSTKRDSNAFNGALGIGCKSALAYGTQFTVSSVKNGVETVVIVSREEDGSGTMTPMSAGLTQKPSGTEVRVPINRSDFYRIESKAKDLFKFWPEGSVTVNGSAPARFEGLRITDDLYITTDETSRVVMGNVPYPAPTLDGLCPAGGLVAFVPIGAVNFPPSREALQDTKQTRATLAAIKDTFEQEVPKAIQREVDKCATPADAVRTVVRWARYVPGGRHVRDYTYKGNVLPLSYPHPLKWTVSEVGNYRQGSSSQIAAIPASEWPGAVWVTGFTPANYTILHKRKMNKWCEDNGIATPTKYVCTTGSLPTDEALRYIDPARIIDWEDVRKIQLQARNSRGPSGRIPGSYDCFTEQGYQHGVEGAKLRRDVPLLYLRGNRWMFSRFEDAVKAAFPAFTVVLLSENRVAKWKRIVPESREVQDALNAYAQAFVDTLSEDVRTNIAMDERGFRSVLRNLDARKLKDPALVEAIRIARIDTRTTASKLSAVRSRASASLKVNPSNPLSAYPLFQHGGVTEDHLYWYLNAAFEAGV